MLAPCVYLHKSWWASSSVRCGATVVIGYVKKRNKRHLVLKMNSTRQEKIVCRATGRKERFDRIADVSDQLRDPGDA